MAQSFAASRGRIDSRAQFITLTYLHLFAAVMAFVALEVFLFQSGLAYSIAQTMFRGGSLMLVGGFVIVSWVATRFANSATSMGAQYFGLGLFVVAEAIIFLPLLFMANTYAPGAIGTAAGITALGFAGLTAVVFTTRKDFSFLGSVLRWVMMLALVAIVSGAIFGFELGVFFNIAMVGVAGAAILYDTSNVLRHYPTNRHVAASLQLFASVAMLMFYVLRLVMSSRD